MVPEPLRVPHTRGVMANDPTPPFSDLPRITLGVLAIGAIAVTVMLTPWKFEHGIVFDTRSVLLGISGLFFGSVPTATAMAMTAVPPTVTPMVVMPVTVAVVITPVVNRRTKIGCVGCFVDWRNRSGERARHWS